ncbi:MAG: hypothetical protein AAGH65_06925 [Pseudomonadota bacterium]
MPVRPLGWLLVCLLTISLLACSESEPPVPETTQDYWQRLERALKGVKTSPDHLPAEHDRIIASGDIQAAIAFVRSSFRVMPDSPEGYRFPTTARRWGAVGTLRAGMGTPRDLADLLAGMLQDMGHETSVVAYRHSQVRDLHDYTPAAFEPIMEPQSLGAPIAPRSPEPSPILDADVEAIAAEVLSVIPDQAIATRLIFGTPNILPVVQLEANGALSIADLWGPTGGLIAIERSLSPEQAEDIPAVTVRLKTLGLGEAVPATVAELTAGLDQLLGRQIMARFAPAVESPIELLDRAPADLDVFLPTLFVPGQNELVATGDPIDISGSRLVENAQDEIQGQSDAKTDGGLLSIANVSIERIDASRFPTVELIARVTDHQDQPIAGLAATTMSLTEQGIGLRARLQSNAASPPRVLFLVDGSLSVPPEYRGAGAGTVVRRVAEGIAASIPNAQFRVALERAGNAESATPWTTDFDALERAARASSSTSKLWQAYADAQQRYAPDVIVMSTDGVSADLDATPQPEADPAIAEQLRAAVPAVMLGSGDLGEAFAGIAELTGGVALAIDDQAAGIEAATAEVIEGAAEVHYRISFQAPASEQRQRQVRLQVGDQVTEASYQVPERDGTLRGKQLAGLYIELEYPTGSKPLLRTLAGLDPAQIGRFGAEEIDQRTAEDVRVALFGEWALSIDGGAVSPSQLLSDLFEHRLSLKNLFKAQSEEELLAGLEAVEPRSKYATLFSSPLAGPSAHLVYELGARFWLETSRRTVTPDGEFHLGRHA